MTIEEYFFINPIYEGRLFIGECDTYYLTLLVPKPKRSFRNQASPSMNNQNGPLRVKITNI